MGEKSDATRREGGAHHVGGRRRPSTSSNTRRERQRGRLTRETTPDNTKLITPFLKVPEPKQPNQDCQFRPATINGEKKEGFRKPSNGGEEESAAPSSATRGGRNCKAQSGAVNVYLAGKKTLESSESVNLWEEQELGREESKANQESPGWHVIGTDIGGNKRLLSREKRNFYE